MQGFKLRELPENEQFEPSTLFTNTPFTQSSFYGAWQISLGRKVRRFTILKEGSVIGFFQIIRYPLLRKKTYLYSPYGPLTHDTSPEFFIFLKTEIARITKEENAVFTRLDFTPPLPDTTLAPYFTKAPLSTYHSAYFQPRVEWCMDLTKKEEELLARMDKKHRYSIRMAESKDIKVEIVKENFNTYFDIFYEIMSETSERNKFNLHPKAYYQNIFKNLNSDYAFVVLARLGERILAVDVIIMYGGIANYVYGASRNEERERMPSYLAQWKAILEAKAQGCTHYTFGGISTPAHRNKGWEGLSRFKTRFGGEEMIHSQFFDVVADPILYHLYNIRKFIKNIGL